MTGRKRSFLQIPQGAEGIYLEEAYKHLKILEDFHRLFISWGYFPLQTPVMDFYDLYRPLLEGKTDTLYRLIDREGDLLLLRNDITLFLAKQMGLSLAREDLPVRVSYADIILRHQDKEDINKNEFFQLGAELIGKEGLFADLEILTLLFKSLEILSLKLFVHLGSQGLFIASFGMLEEKLRNSLRRAISTRELPLYQELLEETFGKERASLFLQLYQFLGSASELKKLLSSSKASSLTREEIPHLEHLLTLAGEMEKIGYSRELRIDLSEIGNQFYHTGIVFQVYMEGLDSAVASGGRYDKLLEYFGFPSPSVGFSILLRKVEPYIKDTPRYALPKKEQVFGESFSEILQKAEDKRREGRTVIL